MNIYIKYYGDIFMKKVMLVFGTRPEAIKMCPLVLELKKRTDISTCVCVTGQHGTMLDDALGAFGIKPECDLSLMREGQSLFDITTGVINGMKSVLESEKPDIVLVHGDTTSAFAAALSAFYMRIPVGHVEAGLRTHDIYSPYPEEFNRNAVDIIAEYRFCPTEKSRENLAAQGIFDGVYVTGNTVIDALKETVKSEYSHPLLERTAGKRLVLITAHRRENIGAPLENMLSGIREEIEAHSDVMAIYPVHPNPPVKKTAEAVFAGCDSVVLCEPLSVVDFHNILARCYLVVTDSGGIQEEATALGKPTLVMRDTTERPEGITMGTLRLVGTKKDAIRLAVKTLLDDPREYGKMARGANPYGDGKACVRIANILSAK